MDKFVVSARKYRPKQFDDLVGQETIAATLKNAIQTDQLAQSFLFCGPRGVGKTSCARILAKTINCENLSDQLISCETCSSCKSFQENNSFNIHELDAASNNSVDNIRSLTDQVRTPPHEGKYKIYIIDEVHMLSSAAFNAFLKTLEEPPPYAKFILATTEKHKIIPTILSRCQIYDFNRISVEDITAQLKYISEQEQIEYDEDALRIIANKADGALRDALSIFDRLNSFSGRKLTYDQTIEHLNILDHDYFFKLTEAFMKEDVTDVMLIFDDILNRGFEADQTLQGLNGHFRDLLMCKDARTLKLLEMGRDIQKRYQDQAALVPADFLLSALNICNQAQINYKLSHNKRLHTEMALMKLVYLNRALKLPIQASSNEQAVVAPSKKKPIEVTQPIQPKAKVEDIEVEAPIETHPETAVVEVEKEDEPIAKTQEPEVTQEKITLDDSKSNQFEAKAEISIPLSFDDSTEKVDDENTSSVLDEDVSNTDEPSETKISQDKLLESWKFVANQLKEEGNAHIASLMGMLSPILLENNLIEVQVANALQHEMLEEQKQKIVECLREKSGESKLKMLSPVILEDLEANHVTKPFTAREKYEDLKENYPMVSKLKDQLDLELDY